MLFSPFSELDLDTWRQVQAVNVEAAFQLCAAFVPGMADRGFGRIINVASNTVWKPPGRGSSPISPAKALSSVSPARSRWNWGRAASPSTRSHRAWSPGAEEGNTPEHFDEVRRAQAIQRSLRPGDMAGTVAFLASDDASMITGQTIRIDGGLVTL